MTDELSNDRSS